MEYFDWAAGGYSNATENLFLGMNSHINYDLAIATWESGYLKFAKNAFHALRWPHLPCEISCGAKKTGQTWPKFYCLAAP